MTRKDFELIARIIKTLKGADNHERMAIMFADALIWTNAGFDRARFLKACGL